MNTHSLGSGQLPRLDTFSLMTDTTAEAAALVREAILRTSPPERMRRSLEMSEQLRALSLSSLRRRHPHLSTLQLVELLLGETLISSVNRDAPRGA